MGMWLSGGAIAQVSDSSWAAKANLSAISAADETYEHFIVKFHDGSIEHADPSSTDRMLADISIETGISLKYTRTLAMGAHLIEVGKAVDARAAFGLMQAFAKRNAVEYIEPDARMYPLLTPNDTRYNEQWHYFENAGGIRAPQAWDLATGQGVKVAVLDTGIVPHTDLNANMVGGYDFVSNATNARDGNGRDSNPRDEGDWSAAGECGSGSPASGSSWHGTHVAGTVAAVSNNAKGVAGVAYNSQVVPIRVLAKCGGSLSDIADAIIWASGGSVTGVPANANPAKVINMSLGGTGTCGTTYQNAINSAVGRGSVVVVAAGNSNTNASNARPANCSNVVTVAATNRSGGRSYYSNYGAVVDVAAPGGELTQSTSVNGVLSTLNASSTTPGAENYAFYQGTSMAAPHAAGVAALILSVANKSPAEIETILKNTARAFPATCSQCGSGIVDAFAAVQNAAGGGGTNPPPTGTLQNGVALTNLSGATGSETRYTIQVPAGATNLSIATSLGTGDVDLYVRFGSAPTTSTYNCRPYLNGNNETCTFATPQAGTYHVMLRAYSAYSGVRLLASFTAPSGGGTQPSFFQNTTRYNINDNSTIESPITVSGRTGNAPSTLKVDLTIYHTYRGDLQVYLIAPNGTSFTLHNRTGGSAQNLIGSYTVNASAIAANGTWRLRVRDRANGDVGYLDKWSLQF